MPKDEIAGAERLDPGDLGFGFPAVHDPRSLAPASRGEVRRHGQCLGPAREDRADASEVQPRRDDVDGRLLERLIREDHDRRRPLGPASQRAARRGGQYQGGGGEAA